MFEILGLPRGQLISKGKNEQKQFDLRYYSTVRSNFVRFSEELKTPKSPFEIN